ncbi:MAG TPA: response regulator [Saprospiraceae bacterium]|nr:response regulator [Saprospiraceae bacterium]
MKIILVIEDNSNLRENTCEILELSGYEVYSAVNGMDGIALAKEKKPHIILCDIMMPEADGFVVLKELKTNSETSDIPVIFLTASAEKSDVIAGLGMGANGYIRKPFGPGELFSEIELCLKEVNGE